MHGRSVTIYNWGRIGPNEREREGGGEREMSIQHCICVLTCVINNT